MIAVGIASVAIPGYCVLVGDATNEPGRAVQKRLH